MADVDIELEDQSAVVLDIEGGIQFPARLSGAGGVIVTQNGFDYTIAVDSSALTYSWGSLTGVPTTFPPSAHTHPQSDITGLAASLAGLVPTTRTVAGKALSADVALVKGDVGLGNVDNTADASKPVSTAQATADGLRLLKTANLSDVASVATALTNLGITAFVQTLLDDTTAAAVLTTLGFAGAGGSPGEITIPLATPVRLKWGLYNAGGANGVTVTFANAFPTACDAVFGVSSGGNFARIVSIGAISTTSFVGYRFDDAGTASTVGFYWLAIGR